MADSTLETVAVTRTPQRADEVIPDTTVITHEEITRARAGSYGARQYDAGLQASSSRFDGAANANRLGGYDLLNLYTTWRLTPEWSLLLRRDNALDKRYELARHYGAAGRSGFAALRYGIR